MADARISTSLPTHPKTKKLIRRLGVGAAWHLVRLFLWVAENRSDGDLSGLSDEDLELAVDFDGEEGAFVHALRDVGFIDGEQGAGRIHDWEVHNPWAAGAEARSEKSRWAALCKRYGRDEAARSMPEYAARLPKQQTEQATGTQKASDNVPDAVPESATGTPLAESGAAPSPLPLPSPLPSPLPNSVPDGTGGKPPKMTDPSEIIFGYGLSLLVNAGTAEKQARSFLGGLRKTHGDLTLIDTLRECARAKPLQPLEWLAAALPPPTAGGRKRNKQEELEDRNRQIGDEWVREMMAKEGENHATQ